MLRGVTTFALFTAVSASCAENPSLPECAARGSELLQKNAVRGGIQTHSAEMMSFEALKEQTVLSFAEAKKIRSRSKLLIEQKDQLIRNHQVKMMKSFSDGTCLEHARDGFHDFIDSSGLAEELSDAEVTAFQERLMEEMEVLCKHHGTDTIQDPQQQATVFIADLLEALRAEMPVLSERLFHLLQQEASYTLHFTAWLANFSAADFQRRTGITHTDETVNASMLQTHAITDNIMTRSLPASFESASEWPECAEIIMRIHNQGQCGSCWAFGASSALDARLCIATKGVFSGPRAQLSRGFVASCAPPNNGDGCQGGWSDWVFDLMAGGGVPTGGDLGCHPYFGHGEGTEHFAVSGSAPPCPTQCGNSGFGRTLGEDKFTLTTRKYITIASYYHPYPEKVYHLAREALLQGGPIPAYLYADSGFMAYGGGIYTHGCDSSANHAITVVGYGPDYWNCLNSWGEGWGVRGTFKVGLCVLTDFQIPSHSLAGDSSGYSFPLEGNSSSPTSGLNPSTEYTSVEALAKEVDVACQGTNWGYCEFPTISPCKVDAAGCISSPDYDPFLGNLYPDHSACSFDVKEKVAMEVEDFNVEAGYDFVIVNNVAFSGSSTPHGKVGMTSPEQVPEPNSIIQWYADYSVRMTGFKICHRPLGPCKGSERFERSKRVELLKTVEALKRYDLTLKEYTILFASLSAPLWPHALHGLHSLGARRLQPDAAARHSALRIAGWRRAQSLLQLELKLHREGDSRDVTDAAALAAGGYGKAALWPMVSSLMACLQHRSLQPSLRLVTAALGTLAAQWRRAAALTSTEATEAMDARLVTTAAGAYNRAQQWLFSLRLLKRVEYLSTDPQLQGVLVDALAKGQQLPMLLETLQWRLRPNLITMTAALGACGPDSVGGLKSWQLGLHMAQAQEGADVVLYNHLVSMCDRIGHWELALFLGLRGCRQASLRSDLVTWNSLASAATSQWETVATLLQSMGSRMLRPGIEAVGAMLSAARRAGIWDVAMKSFATLNAEAFDRPVAMAIGACDFSSHWPHGVHLLEMAVPVGPGTSGRGHESCAALVDCCSKAGCWRRAADTLVEMQGRSMDAGAMGGKPGIPRFKDGSVPIFRGEIPMLGLILVGEIHISVLQNPRFCSVK
ncbi:unnamed protein product [Cladocopium goreaui]|uniref:Peptidase C1A papain C-terminal domain-containing protein n=1 Tax=Cladocopium goreaui TaxID=2562237 RepID=A0A9P1CD73_9DINO|nr:unnamed protein product [Cladocopium goreaui]